MRRDSRYAFFGVPSIGPAGFVSLVALVLALCVSVGCSNQTPVKEKPAEKKQEKVVTDLNIKPDSAAGSGDNQAPTKQEEKEGELETLPFDDDPQDGQSDSLPSLNGPD